MSRSEAKSDESGRLRDRRAELARYVDGWRARGRRREASARAWQGEAKARAEQVVAMLVRDYSVTGVVLFGSVAQGRGAPGSDVDLLVEGLEGERYFEASAAARGIMRDIEIDLVPRQWARAGVLERAYREGIRLLG